MPHHCIVLQCNNNSVKCPELSFYRLPLHDENLLKKWLVNIRRQNTSVNEHSRVCSAHFENGKKEGKDAVPTLFAWTKRLLPDLFQSSVLIQWLKLAKFVL